MTLNLLHPLQINKIEVSDGNFKSTTFPLTHIKVYISCTYIKKTFNKFFVCLYVCLFVSINIRNGFTNSTLLSLVHSRWNKKELRLLVLDYLRKGTKRPKVINLIDDRTMVLLWIYFFSVQCNVIGREIQQIDDIKLKCSSK